MASLPLQWLIKAGAEQQDQIDELCRRVDELSPVPDDTPLDRAGAAEILGVHPNTVLSWGQHGQIDTVTLADGQAGYSAQSVHALRQKILGIEQSDMTSREKVLRANSLLAEAAVQMRREGASEPADLLDSTANTIYEALAGYDAGGSAGDEHGPR
jgi:hypothetical protein